jgi:hypothetical protein
MPLWEKAIEVDPNCAPPYTSLAGKAAMRGDVAKQRQYLEKALQLDPSSSEYAWSYAMTFALDDPARYRREMEKVAANYPGTRIGLIALYDAAKDAPALADRIAGMERIRNEYLRNKQVRRQTAPGLSLRLMSLFNLYSKSDPAKALALAEEVQQTFPADKHWAQIADYQKTLIEARNLIAQSPSRALALLEKQMLPSTGSYDRFSDIDRGPWKLAKAEALAKSGDTAGAYKDLTEALIPVLNPDLQAAAEKYGSALGKSSQQVEAEIWQLREAKAEHLKAFELTRLDNKQSVKLSDFHGKAVLVDFWNPG